MKVIPYICLLLLLVLVGCKEEQYLICPDGVTQVLDLNLCPAEAATCPASCDDDEACTSDFCNPSTNFECAHRLIVPCEGNSVCEQGEYSQGTSADCPVSCDDGAVCTIDSFNFISQICVHDEILPCCNNLKCDAGETFVTCPTDCKQSVNIEVLKYEKRQKIETAQNDLTGTDYTYLIVQFTLHNVNVEKAETLNFKTEKGFYYDPFKMRLEDDKNNLYNVEYDSDSLPSWLDYAILPKGKLVTASIMFIVPLTMRHSRLVAYDKYGARLDISEIY